MDRDEAKAKAERELREAYLSVFAGMEGEDELRQAVVEEIWRELRALVDAHGEAGLRLLAENIRAENGWLLELLEEARSRGRASEGSDGG